jgi:hypothetical protein
MYFHGSGSYATPFLRKIIKIPLKTSQQYMNSKNHKTEKILLLLQFLRKWQSFEVSKYGLVKIVLF